MAGLVAPILPIIIKLTGIVFDVLGKGFVQDPLSKMQTMLTVNETLLANRTDLIDNWNKSSSWNIESYYDSLEAPHEPVEGFVQTIFGRQITVSPVRTVTILIRFFHSSRFGCKGLKYRLNVINRKSSVATIYILPISIRLWINGPSNILSHFNSSELVYSRSK